MESQEERDMNKKMWIVTPGEKVPKRPRYGETNSGETYFVKTPIGYVATHLGVIKKTGRGLDLIPYKNVYTPRRGDYVVGVVTAYAPNGWIVDIGASTKAFLAAQELIRRQGGERRFDPKTYDLTQQFSIGDLIGAVIYDINAQSHAILSLNPEKTTVSPRHIGKLNGYFVIKVHTTKIPRIIGKKGSMIKMIKENIDGDIVIGQNGVILFKGDYEKYLLLKKIINTIISRTFAPGLTGKIASMLGTTLENGENDTS